MVRALASQRWPGFDSRTRRHMWVEFVVGSLLCSERFSSGYSGFSLSSKTNISKFKFDLDYFQALYHERPLARMITQALPVFDIKFTFFFSCLNLRSSYNSYLTQSTHGTRRVHISLSKLHQDVKHFILILQGILKRGEQVNEKQCNTLGKESDC